MPSANFPCRGEASAGSLEIDCPAKIATYRQCPVPGCGWEVGFCPRCGGDARAVEYIRAHIAQHAAPAPSAAGEGG